MPRKYLLLLCLSSSLFLSYCNSNKGENKDATTNTDSKTTQNETSSTSASTPGEERAKISVSLAGGDMAGTYSAVCRDACCSWGIAGENVFGNQYSKTGKGPKELSSFQLIVDNVTQGNKT